MERHFLADEPTKEQLTALVRRYHHKGLVTTAWWEDDLRSGKGVRAVVVTRRAKPEDRV